MYSVGPVPSLQDFQLVKTYVDRILQERNLSQPSLAFPFFALDLILNLQEDEIEDAITDTTYLSESGKEKGHDRGIDAIYIDDTETPATVHLFSFKYTNSLKHTTNHFPAVEIDKICSFIMKVMQQDEELKLAVSKPLFSKVEDIWNLFTNQSPKFAIHICANYYNGFELGEQKRFERELNKFSNFEILYHLMPHLVSRLTRRGKKLVNARIRAIDKNLFEKSDGDIRALIVDFDARDLLRIVMDDERVRHEVDLSDYSVLQQHQILEDAFEDNVRVYLKQRTKINRNIRETALSDDAHRFFYFNNGITITCSHFDYPKQVRAPIIELENLQVVNGSQTIHALFDAFSENSSKFNSMDVLCRIYETRNESLSTDIAEYTNSQNPVTTRDIRSNDFVQKKLERELEALGYFYERKKSQHINRAKHKKIDAEKAGQALLAFFNKMPAEAKARKKIIFAEKYDEVFSDSITADSVLIAVRLFDDIERRKLKRKREILEDVTSYEDESFILHATYYILHILSELSDRQQIDKVNCNYDLIMNMYDEAVALVRQAIQAEKDRLQGYKEKYNHRLFFVGNNAKLRLQDLFNKFNI